MPRAFVHASLDLRRDEVAVRENQHIHSVTMDVEGPSTSHWCERLELAHVHYLPFARTSDVTNCCAERLRRQYCRQSSLPHISKPLDFFVACSGARSLAAEPSISSPVQGVTRSEIQLLAKLQAAATCVQTRSSLAFEVYNVNTKTPSLATDGLISAE